MRICDVPEEQIKVGLRVKSLARPLEGTVTKCEDVRGLPYWWIQWDGEDRVYSGFFNNDCKCEIV